LKKVILKDICIEIVAEIGFRRLIVVFATETYRDFISGMMGRFYKVDAKEALQDPDLDRGAERAGTVGGMLGGAASGFIGIAAAPFTGGLSLLAMAPATATGFVGGTMARNASEAPEDVYFTLTADNSQWVAQQISPGTIHNLAYNIGS